jgi:hypothetical protein
VTVAYGVARDAMDAPLAAPLEADARPSPLRALRAARPSTVAASTLVLYLAALVPLAWTDGVDSFARVGSRFTSASDRSERISGLRTTAHTGYDGQFAYFIALDPQNARYYIDSPSYRYGRVLYPATARIAALGQPGAIPYALLAINLLAIACTVLLLGVHLIRRGSSAWWAAVYGFFPGLALCLFADLTEPLAYLLATAALLLLLERKPPPVVLSGVLFALAALTRETTLVFAAAGAAWLLLSPRTGRTWRSVGSATLLGMLAVVPYAAFRVTVDRWLGVGLQSNHFSARPFAGFTGYGFNDDHKLIFLLVIVPALAWLALAAWSAQKAGFDVAVALVVANVAVFVVWLPSDAYIDLRSAYRALIPVVISSLLLLPTLQKRLRRDVVFSAVFPLTVAWAVIASSLTVLL